MNGFKYYPTFDDLVFEFRNKEYGAYQLRKKYSRTLAIATLIGIIFMTTAIIVPYIKAARTANFKKRDAKEVIAEMANDIQNQEAPPPPPPPPPPAEQQTVVKYVAPVVVDSIKPEEQNQLAITDEQVETTVNKEAVEIVETKQEEVQDDATKEEVFIIVEEMPEFPGGEGALRAFIAKSIEYPVIAQENGIQGKVYVTFVVDKDGGISDAKVVRGVDPSLDKEALRVVNSLPKWKPGKQRGKPVRVSYTVPISFVLQ
jgi:periplasmic protein TonB